MSKVEIQWKVIYSDGGKSFAHQPYKQFSRQIIGSLEYVQDMAKFLRLQGYKVDAIKPV
jgi:hypothetical protein